jgi:Secretion system C-terminal sorting domain
MNNQNHHSLVLVILLILSSFSAHAQWQQQGPKLVGTGRINESLQGSSTAISADGNTAVVGGCTDSAQTGAVWVFTRSGGTWRQQGPKLVGTGAIYSALQGISVAVSADGNTLIEGGYRDAFGSGAVWVFVRVNGEWHQQGPKILTGPDASGPGLSFGAALALSGDGNTAIIGAVGDNNNVGAVWVYKRTNGVWTQEGPKLVGAGYTNIGAGSTNPRLNTQGSSVAISGDGNTAVIGCPADDSDKGALWVFTRTNGVWTQLGSKLVAAAGLASSVYLGAETAISSDGNTIFARANESIPGVGISGIFWTFVRTNGVWTQLGNRLNISNLPDMNYNHIGTLSADGQTAAVNANNINQQSLIWIYKRTGANWVLQFNETFGTIQPGFAFASSSFGRGGVSFTGDGNAVLTGDAPDNLGVGAAWVFANQCSGTPAATQIIANTICPNTAATLALRNNFTSQGISFQWQTSNTAGGSYTNLGGENTQLTNTLSATTYYRCTISCLYSGASFTTPEQAIVVAPATIPTISGLGLPISPVNQPIAVCRGSALSLDVGAGYSTYQWSTGANTQILPIPNTATIPNNQSYTVTVTNAIGCSATASRQISFIAISAPSISGTPTICQGGSTNLLASSGYTSYAWSNGINTASAAINATGTYTVTVTDAAGCTNTQSQTVALNTPPTPTITGNASICAGNGTTLNAGAGYSSYQWNTGANTQTILSNNLRPTGNDVYTVTVTNAQACTNTASRQITINPVPMVVIADTASACLGGATTLNAGNGFATYNWSNGLTTQSFRATTSGIYTVTVTNAQGCSATASDLISIAAVPNINIRGSNSLCSGTNTVLDAGLGFLTYRWSNGATTQSITATSVNTYSVTVTLVGGCTGTGSRILTAATSPFAPVISGATTICTGSSTNFTVRADPCLCPISYRWSSGDTSATLQTAVLAPTTYTVTVSNQSGCTNTASVSVNTFPLPILTITQPTNNASFCNNNTPILLNANPVGGSFSIDNTPIPRPSQGVLPSSLAIGQHAILYTYTDLNFCTASTTRNFSILRSPSATLTGMPPTIRVNSPNVALMGSPTGGVYTGRGMQGNIFNPSTAGVGPDTLTYTYTDITTGCTGRATIIINVSAASISTNDQQPTINEIRLYPNPVTDELNIEISGEMRTKNYEMRITNVLGQEILKNAIDFIDKKANINTSILTNGTYILTVTDQQGRVGVCKFVKK